MADCSPWINSGSDVVKSKDGTATLNISIPSKDAEDNGRVMGSIVDRGALEYFGSALPSYITVNKTICAKDSFLFNGAYRKAPGVFKDTLTNASTCDSFITLNLIASNSSSTINRSICPGTSFTFGSKTLQTSGVYYDTLQNFIGCDSIVTCSLTVYSEASLSIGITPPNLTTLVATPGFVGYGWYRNDTLISTGVSNTYNFNGTKGVYKCAAIRVLGSTVCTTYSNPYSFGMTHTIQVISGPNGTVSPSGTFTKNSNDTFTFTITPNVGFKVDSLFINNIAVAPSTTYFISGVNSDFTFRAVFKSLSSDINTIENTTLEVYPNPAEDVLHLNIINDIPMIGVIQHLNGQQMPCVIEQKQINIQSLPAGIYILKINENNELKSTKFIKK